MKLLLRKESVFELFKTFIKEIRNFILYIKILYDAKKEREYNYIHQTQLYIFWRYSFFIYRSDATGPRLLLNRDTRARPLKFLPACTEMKRSMEFAGELVT